MSDLISRSALLEEFEWLKENTGAYNHAALDEHIQRIKNAPAVDAEPVRHGRWEYIRTANGGRLQCMECKHYIDAGNDKNFCPNCGAKMDMEVEG